MLVLLREEIGFFYFMIFMFKLERCLIVFVFSVNGI